MRKGTSEAVRQVIENLRRRKKGDGKGYLNAINSDMRTAGVREDVLGDRVERGRLGPRVTDPNEQLRLRENEKKEKNIAMSTQAKTKYTVTCTLNSSLFFLKVCVQSTLNSVAFV